VLILLLWEQMGVWLFCLLLILFDYTFIIHSVTHVYSYSIYFGVHTHFGCSVICKVGFCFCFTIMLEYSFGDLDQK
jgi:hypothetical protein